MRMFHKPRRKTNPAAVPQVPAEAAPAADPLPNPVPHPAHHPSAQPHAQPRRPQAQGSSRPRPPAKHAGAPQFTPFEREIRYFFRRKELLEQALTHSSFAYEKQAVTRDNELLEFLGDSVIGLITADFFYSSYQDMTEGDLSKLKSSAASTVALAEFSKQIKLDKHIHLGRGEERSGGRKKSTILAGVFEAVVGAVYLDGGFEAARGFFPSAPRIDLQAGQDRRVHGRQLQIGPAGIPAEGRPALAPIQIAGRLGTGPRQSLRRRGLFQPHAAGPGQGAVAQGRRTESRRAGPEELHGEKDQIVHFGNLHRRKVIGRIADQFAAIREDGEKNQDPGAALTPIWRAGRPASAFRESCRRRS